MKLTKRQTQRLQHITNALGLDVSDVRHLLTQEKFLHSWHEKECGNDYGCIQWEDVNGTERPFWLSNRNYKTSPMRDNYIPRRARLAEWCAERGLHFYIQPDPRGCALYVSRQPIPENNYTQATAMYL